MKWSFCCPLRLGACRGARPLQGDRVQIAAYLGKSERFDGAIANFAQAYADQTERDHAALCDAVKSGRLPVDEGA